MNYSVVILSRNLSNLGPCVAAVQENEPHLPAANIIVVDDDETGKIEHFCASNGLNRVAGTKPFIFARAANTGLTAAFSDSDQQAILLNDDALLRTRRGFSKMVQQTQIEGKYGLVASSCNNVGNENQHPRNGAVIRREPRMLCFVCVLIPRSTWVKAGALDERYSGYGLDDDDYSLRVRQAGMRLGVFDGCFVDHGSLTSTFRGPAGAGGDFSHNLELFRQKWGFDNHGRPA